MNESRREHPTTDRRPSAGVRRWTLVATILASSVVFLNNSVVNVALPSIDRALGVGLSGLQWIVDGYTLTLAALLILGGSLGDRYGRRRVMLVGLIIFGFTSVACGLAPSFPWLLAARVFQGIGGALMVPGSLAIIRAVYTEDEARGEAIGKWSGWSGITTVLGPLVGGWMVDTLSWRWVFFLGVPIVATAVWLMVRFVPETRNEEAGRLDWAGAALATTALGGLAYGLIEGPVLGWGATSVVVGLVVGSVTLVLFFLVESRVRHPMVPLKLFRVRNFTGANLTTLGVYFALTGTSFFLVIYLQSVVGYSALMAGLALAPISMLLLLLSSFFGRQAAERGPRLFMTLGPLVVAVGLILISGAGPGANYWTDVLPGVLVLGLGLASTVAPLTDTVMSAVADRHAGIAAAVNNAVSRVAGLIAVAGLGVVLATTFDGALEQQIADLSLSSPARTTLEERIAENPTGQVDTSGLPEEAVGAVEVAYTQAFRRVMLVNAALAGAGGVTAALLIRKKSGEEPVT